LWKKKVLNPGHLHPYAQRDEAESSVKPVLQMIRQRMWEATAYLFPIVQEALAYMRIVSDPFNNGISFAKVFSREGVKEHNLQKVNIMARKLVRNNGAQGDGIYTVLLNHLDDIDIDQRDLVASVIDRMQELIDHKKNHLPSDTLKHLLMEKTDLYRSVLQEDTRISRKNIEVLNALVRMVEDLELIGGGSEFEEVMEHMALVFDMDIEDGEAGEKNLSRS
jgi:DNA helicase-2/ATP-dependent DNA helicase PcrA